MAMIEIHPLSLGTGSETNTCMRCVVLALLGTSFSSQSQARHYKYYPVYLKLLDSQLQLVPADPQHKQIDGSVNFDVVTPHSGITAAAA
jgi:hypothetical protein